MRPRKFSIISPMRNANANAAAAGCPNHDLSVPVSLKQEAHPLGMADPPPSSSDGPIRIDGYEQDAAMSKSKVLSRSEVLKRRSRRLKQLDWICKKIYWDWLMEGELRSKAREYYWEYGSPFVEEENEGINPSQVGNGNGDSGVNGENRIGNGWNRCGMQGCKAKAMALTRFCHMHIMNDAKQSLYKECRFIIKSSTSGPIHCKKPVLRSTVPCYCPAHFQTSEKHMVRALKKSGVNVASTSKLAPKLHVLVSEYVRQIQHKRRSAQRANLGNAQVKEENKF